MNQRGHSAAKVLLGGGVAILAAVGIILAAIAAFYSCGQAAIVVHYDVVVVNNSEEPVVLDLGDTGPPARTAEVRLYSTSNAFPLSNLWVGDTVRFWNKEKTTVLETRKLDGAYAETHIGNRRIVLEFPKGSESPKP